MTDTHSHILPGIDDGPKSVEESVKLLEMLAEQGVTHVAATPHYKPITGETVASFLARRDKAEAELRQAIAGRSDLPSLTVGAEVTISVELAQLEGLERLCYRDTPYLLIELDPNTVAPWVLHTLYDISNRLMLVPVIAHIDRYLGAIPPKLLEDIMKLNCPVQFNGYSLASFYTKRRLIKLMNSYDQTVFVVGSDCHGIALRPPEMELFSKKAIKLLGEDFYEEICENSRAMLDNSLIV